MKTFETSTHSKELDTIYEKPVDEIENIVFDDADLTYDFKSIFRLIRKRFFALIKKNLKKSFKEVLIVTLDNPPYDYISAFRNQYPDVEIKVLIPIHEICGIEKTRFDFYLQNRMNSAVLYKLPSNTYNIKVYGLFSTAFSKKDLQRLQYLAPFVKAARIAAKRLKPDIIHSANVPFFLGAEFEPKYPIKVFQVVYDFMKYETNKTETFWAAINLVNKNGMKKICRDTVIKKCIASLFNLHNTKRFYQMRECLEFIYNNYFKFRKYVDKCEDIDENILFNRMNARVLKLFPQIVYGDEIFFNTMYYSIKKADFWSTISETYYNEIFQRPKLSGKIFKRLEKTKSKSTYVSFGCNPDLTPIYQSFSSQNFRELRSRNKKYLLKEFSEERVRTKFVDINLFKTEEYIIRGYLDSFFESPLIFCTFTPEVFEQGIDIAFNAILKLFETNKNVQFIININNGLKNSYIKSRVDFAEKNTAFNGRWVFIDGKINLAQFYAAADMIFIPARTNIVTTKYLYALQYGCVPIAARNGILNDIIADIFDDISYGCGFKTKSSLMTDDDTNEIFLTTVNKALKLYSNNPSSWNLLIKNSLNSNCSWKFEIIEKYNDIYNRI